MSLLLLISLAGCSEKLREGEVYDKEFTPEYTTLMMIPHTMMCGKSVITYTTPMYVHHPDSWSISIKAYNEKEQEWETATYWVDQEVYDTINIGDQFVYSEETCLEEAPYTREPAE